MKKRSLILVILMVLCSTSAMAATPLEAQITGKPFSPKFFHLYADLSDTKTSKVGIICGYDDDMVIESLLPEGWAQVRLPEEAGVGYCDTADVLVNPDFSAKPLTVREATTVYSRYDCQVDLGAMEPGDACMLTGVHQGHSQVLWQTADHAYRIGWLDGVYAAENGQLILTEASAPSTWPGWKLVERLLVLLLCHFVGDFVLQNAYLSDEKKRSWYHLLVHCFLYILPFYVCFSLCWQLGCILVAHFVIDAAKARKERISLAQDQALHIVLLLLYLL